MERINNFIRHHNNQPKVEEIAMEGIIGNIKRWFYVASGYGSSYELPYEQGKSSGERYDLSDYLFLEVTANNWKALKKQYPWYMIGQSFRQKNAIKLLWIDEKAQDVAVDVVICPDMELIVDINITPKYQRHQLAAQVLDVCIKTYHCNKLETFNNGKVAEHTYSKYGFQLWGRTTKDPEDEMGVGIWEFPMSGSMSRDAFMKKYSKYNYADNIPLY